MYFNGKRKFLAFHLAPGRSARDGEIFADIAMALASQKARGRRRVFLSFSALSYGSLPLKEVEVTNHITLWFTIIFVWACWTFFLFFLSVRFFFPFWTNSCSTLVSFGELSVSVRRGAWEWAVTLKRGWEWHGKATFLHTNNSLYTTSKQTLCASETPLNVYSSSSWKILGRYH